MQTILTTKISTERRMQTILTTKISTEEKDTDNYDHRDFNKGEGCRRF